MLIRDTYTIECLKQYFVPENQSHFVIPCELEPEQLVKLAVQSSEGAAEGIANCLKIGIEHSADSDPNLALQLADTIIVIGKGRDSASLIGLGTMAQGDIMAHSGLVVEAWDKLEQAGKIYQGAQDEIGWARTRIGRLQISPELDSSCVQEAFADARAAEQIFLKAGRYDRLLRLYHGWAFAYVLMGRYEEAILYYQQAVQIVQNQFDPNTSKIMIAYLYSDMGYAHNNLGELRTAMEYLTQARQVLRQAQQHATRAMAEFGMANNHVIRGEYRQALYLLLNSILPNLKGHRADAARLTVIDCYLALNRNEEAYELAQETLRGSQNDPNRKHQKALSALFLATAQTRLGLLTEAQESLNLAEINFAAYRNMAALIQLKRGQVALRQGDFGTARSVAHTIAGRFWAWQQPLNWIDATLLEAEAALCANDLRAAQRLGRQALKYAREQDLLLPARYRCYLVLGQILEKQGRSQSSVQMYDAALAILQHIQRSLTVSLRPGFLEDKLLPFLRLMDYYLSREQVEEAFCTLERLKSQVFQDYLVRREPLRWVENEQTRPLLNTLYKLRDKHQWLFKLQSAPPAAEAEARSWYQGAGSYSNLQQDIAECEKQMRQLTEQLYLFSEIEPPGTHVPQLSDIQKCLDENTILIEFYTDRERVWGLGITPDTAILYSLTEPITTVQKLVEDKWQSNLEFALEAGSHDHRTQVLTAKAQSIGERLYQLLLQPMAEQMKDKKRLVIVPYGFLHQLPFNILRHDNRYLIETHEIVISPSASLMLRTQPSRKGGAMVAAHSWDGRLSFSIAEGRMVHEWMGGTVFLEKETHRELLQHPPRKVLHISTHGEHRIDQPDFAYFELGDGPVYTDDLLQCDLSYELVVLSACELGKANITAGDELIGLGRGFLYAGAGALITGLWRVNEQHTYQLMESLYQGLSQGESKASALQTAQRKLLSQDANLHPAFWAAFQLICNADPLTFD